MKTVMAGTFLIASVGGRHLRPRRGSADDTKMESVHTRLERRLLSHFILWTSDFVAFLRANKK